MVYLNITEQNLTTLGKVFTLMSYASVVAFSCRFVKKINKRRMWALLPSRIWDLAEIELDLHIMGVNIILKFQSPLQVIMFYMPIGNSKWSTAKVNIALKTYELQFRHLLENH